MGGEGEGAGKKTSRRMAVLFPEVKMLEEGQVWSGRSSCAGGAFCAFPEMSDRAHFLL